MALGGQLQILTQPISDGAQLRSALESIQPGDGHASFGELGRALRALAETVRMPIDVHLYSDMQRTAMPANFADLVLPAECHADLHSVANKIAAGQLDHREHRCARGVVRSERPASFACTRCRGGVQHSGGHEDRISGREWQDDRHSQSRGARPMAAPPLSSRPLEVNYGFNRCEVRIEGGDALPADDATVFTVRRSDPQRVLFVHAARDTRSPVYFGSALTAAARSSFVLQSVSQEETTNLDPSRFAFVVLSDSAALPSIFEHTLAQYVARGGNVFIALGTSAARRSRIPVWDGNVADARDYARLAGAVDRRRGRLHPSRAARRAARARQWRLG